MKLVLFSDDINLLSRWEKSLSSYDICIIDHIDDIDDINNSIVVFNPTACDKFCKNFVEKAKKNNNKILVLDRVPNLQTAKNFFAQGISGYGNAIMTISYLNSAIETLENNLVWLLPDLVSQLVIGMNLQSTQISTVENLMLEQLTHKEYEIANLLKNGASNMEISETLDMSINTVKTHIKKIYEKFNIHDRVSFALLFK
jgi:DNA-binding NarL/FixJ family response regulator